MAKWTAKNPGPRLLNLAAEDLVEQYMTVLEEELFNDRIYVTAVKDGVQAPNPNAIHVILSIGQSFSKTPSKKNMGRIYSDLGGEDELAKMIGTVIRDWGKLYSFHHGVQAPIKREAATRTIEIEPFQLNAIDSLYLAPQLHRLGKDLAQVIADFGARKRKVMYGA